MNDFDDDEAPKESADWLATYSDICLLLLTFFILLVAVSSVEVVKYQSIFGSIRDAFGGTAMPDTNSGGQLTNTEMGNEDAQAMHFIRMREEILEAQRRAYNEIKSFITVHGMEGKMSAVLENGIITLTVPDEVMFEPCAEYLSLSAEPVLRELLAIFLSQREMSISIKGYTDNSRPPPGARYVDTWELSALRAVNVLRWFINADIPVVRLAATGMGDLNPRFPNDTEENRARNRRVEFDLERKVGGAR